MARYRRDEQLIEVEKESTYGTEATGSPLVIVPTAVDFSSVHEATIADPQVAVEGGTRPVVRGTFVDAAPTLSTLGQGLGAALADTVAPTAVALTHLLGATFQDAPNAIKTSKVKGATTPTTIESIEDVNDIHVVTAYGSTTPVGMAIFERAASGPHVRPYTYTAGTDALGLRMALPAAQATGDLIRGGYVFQWAQKWSSATPPYSVSVRSLGNSQIQHSKIVGGVAGLSIAAVGPNELPVLGWSFRCSSGAYDFSGTRPSASPARGVVYAGSSLLLGDLAAAGTDANYTEVCGRVDINFAVPSLVAECPNAASGVQGYHRGKEQIEIKLTLPADVAPASVGEGNLSGSSWHEQMLDYPTEHLHLQTAYGQSLSGNTIAFYFPDLVIVGVEEGEINELDSRTLTLRPYDQSTYPLAVAYVG